MATSQGPLLLRRLVARHLFREQELTILIHTLVWPFQNMLCPGVNALHKGRPLSWLPGRIFLAKGSSSVPGLNSIVHGIGPRYATNWLNVLVTVKLLHFGRSVGSHARCFHSCCCLVQLDLSLCLASWVSLLSSHLPSLNRKP